MRYEHLPRKDRLALEWYIDCLKKAAHFSIDYEIYESPSLHIIYLEDSVFDVLEDKIDEILDHNHRFLTINKEILFAPKRFMVSYEEKIEDYPNFIRHDIEIESDFHQELFGFVSFDCEMKNIQSSNITNRNFSELYEVSDKTEGVKNGCAA